MTNTSNLSILAALVVSLSASAAFADDPVAPIPQHNVQNISQINGQLVKVGDHHSYDHSYKRYNIATNPLAMIVGMTSIQGSVAINSMVALRGDLTLYTSDDIGNGAEITASAAIYFRQMYSGLYIEPGLMYRSLQQEDDYYDDSFSSAQESTYTETTAGIQTLVGYHWMWDSGLNLAVAAGAGRNLAANTNEYQNDVFVNGYARFGYAF